jgi:hypothetical protein
VEATAFCSVWGRLWSAARQVRDNRLAAHSAWCARHPDRAAEERELRLQLIEQQDRFGHKVNGTVETHAKASVARQGALDRLHRSGAITIHQLGAAMEIGAAHERILRDVKVSSGWGFDRVDMSRDPESTFFEALGAVRSDQAYSQWRCQVANPGPVLAIIADDLGVDSVARQYRMDRRTLLKRLTAALDLWTRLRREACREIDAATLAAAQAAIF